MRRLGEGDTPELCLQRGLLALEAGRLDVARRLFEKAGGPLGEALVGAIDARKAAAREQAAEDALVELLRQISGSTRLEDRDTVIAAIRKRCEGDPKRVEATRKALAEFERNWGESKAGRQQASIVQTALMFPLPGEPWTVPQVGIELVWVAPGTFQMGSDTGGREIKPVHTVQIARAFWMAKYELTQAEFQTVTGRNPSGLKLARHPVSSLSWREAAAFCATLTERERDAGRLPTDYEFRLPTEAEWEYAARGGAETQGYEYSGSRNPGEVAWYRDNSNHGPHPVGEKKANELGLHDMSGNVWEWCLDWYDEKFYSRSPRIDPLNAQQAVCHASRGGSWDASVQYMNPVGRYWMRAEAEAVGGNNYGFRVCLGPRIEIK
ncbi:MAG: SUMF1/EgtB/PvdO family nonheme iron enzyme [Lentisphaeria bacterium]|nr:SUMF1/EgtB/PvdO family nonheme iron enzyme [Lentisphaeria bacterium]